MTENRALLNAIDRASAAWLELPGVHLVGAGERDGGDCIVVYAEPPLSRLDGLVPARFEGFAVRLVASDAVTAG
jgi:hypothetical protein